ncbi:TetR/AcrR family transcriptional regulator [Shewanella baltica]|uniref:Transcriptional regulator, TetR family n=1 Tax=Shewanella baltica (strain OS155 / ATCC BAA-1091) TaxID=325240 RepID=A3D086_SHEB5|nr:TetR/AcrR family transcriptional regulator [Shewanella baltica]ABN60149.1 transcriptional regulator, TetR family [Shewanella baltica OS155]AEH12545.1 regulatory protein TetR [Shewanella baltica OS117]
MKPKNLPESLAARGRPRNFDRQEALVSALGVFWRRGYEPASLNELCAAMNIKPPSLYAAFGNKAALFLEAVNYYEDTFWDATWERMLKEADLHQAISDFFCEAADILTSQSVPCGCLVVLAAINVSPDSQEVYEAVKALREEGRGYFLARLKQGVEDGQLDKNEDINGIAMTLNTLLEGMSIPAQDGISRKELAKIAVQAVKLLPRSSKA